MRRNPRTCPDCSITWEPQPAGLSGTDKNEKDKKGRVLRGETQVQTSCSSLFRDIQAMMSLEGQDITHCPPTPLCAGEPLEKGLSWLGLVWGSPHHDGQGCLGLTGPRLPSAHWFFPSLQRHLGWSLTWQVRRACRTSDPSPKPFKRRDVMQLKASRGMQAVI